MALTTVWSRIWNYLPILVKRLAFRKGRNDNSGESDHQEPSYELKANLVRSPPGLAGCIPESTLLEWDIKAPKLPTETLEKLGYSEFGDPQAGSSLGLLEYSLTVRCMTYNAAYMILDARTSLLPISRCLTFNGVSPSVIVLFVPHKSTTCTSAIRASSGTKLSAMI